MTRTNEPYPGNDGWVALSWGLDSVIRRMKSWVFVGIDSVFFFTFSINTCIDYAI